MASEDPTIYFEDHEIGETFELGEYHVTKDEIVEFARRYDPQPFHVNEEAAQESMFGELVASGWHTAAMVMKLLVDGRIKQIAATGAISVDDLRWNQPVRPGDELSVGVETVEKRPAEDLPGIGHVHADVTGVGGDDEPVISWTLLGMVEQRDSA